jgi:hypothetical protein
LIGFFYVILSEIAHCYKLPTIGKPSQLWYLVTVGLSA